MNRKLCSAIAEIPAVDIHSHIDRNQMSANDIDLLLFYHMLRYPMMASGFEKDLLWKWESISGEERAVRFGKWLELWPLIENTSFAWILKTFLKDLYGFSKPLTRASFPELQKRFSERSVSNSFAREVMDKGRIELILSSKFMNLKPLAQGEWDGRMLFTNEHGLSGGVHEYRTWPERLKKMEEKAGRQIGDIAGLRKVLEDYYARFDWSSMHAYVAWISSMADFTPVKDPVVDRIIGKVNETADGKGASPEDLRILEAAFIRATCGAIRGKVKIFQLVYGCQFQTAGHRHPEQRAAWDYTNGLGLLCAEFPDLHFNILNGYEPDEPELCSLALAYDNLSLGGFWWHTFYPSVMKTAWRRRLEMVPVSRLQGFFSDGYCVDWVYGRLAMTRKVLSEVLSEKVEQGYYSVNQAVRIAEDVLRIQPKKLFGIP